MKNPDTIFFDLDETLIQNLNEPDSTFQVLYESFPRSLDPERFPPFMDALMANAGELWQNMFETDLPASDQMIYAIANAFSTAGLDGDIATDFFDHFVSSARVNTRLNPNALVVLDNLRSQGLRVGIITNGIEVLQMAKIEHHNLNNHVDCIVVSEQARAHKPSEIVFTYALEKIGSSADSAWHVGDHITNDVLGAINSGMVAVHFQPAAKTNEPDSDKNGGDITPHHLISDLSDILTLLNTN